MVNKQKKIHRLLGQAEISLMFHHSFQKAPLELQLADRWTWYALENWKLKLGQMNQKLLDDVSDVKNP